MPPEALKLLVDIQRSLALISEFTVGMNYEMYRLDEKSRAAVERKFEIIGEASTRLRDRFPDLFSEIVSGPQIIGFRNRLIHGYDNVDDAIIWDIISRKLPELGSQITELINRTQ